MRSRLKFVLMLVPFLLSFSYAFPRVSNVSVQPNPFSPNSDGLKDTATIFFSTSEAGNVTVRILDIPPHVVKVIVENVTLAAGAHSVVWDGTNSTGFVSPYNYLYNITLRNGTGVSNSTLGNVRVDLSPPGFVEYAPMNGFFELGDAVVFTSRLDLPNEPSGISSVFVCNGSSNCASSPPETYCRMVNTSQFWDNFSCSFLPPGMGVYPFNIFANDTQNLFSNRSDSFRVRNTSLLLDGVSPPIADLQGNVTIIVNYTENSSYPIVGASCAVYGDVSASMYYSGGSYVANVSPSRMEVNSFSVNCSKAGYPLRSVSGSFIARDLQVLLGFEFDPLSAGVQNVLYARVSTLNDYSEVSSADAMDFSISGPGGFSASGSFAWNGVKGRWEAFFTPLLNGSYSASAYFRNGSLDGGATIPMYAGDGLSLSGDVSVFPIVIELGSSASVTLAIENRRGNDMVYNVTLLGDLYVVSFDGEALHSHKHSAFAYIPGHTVQYHPLLISGMEASPFEKEVQIQVREAQPPYGAANFTVPYLVVSAVEKRRFAPDIDMPALLLLAFVSLLFLSKNRLFGFEP